MKRSRLLLERIKEQPRAHQRAAESALSRSITKYTKNLQRIFATLYFVRSFFDYLFLQRFILRAVFLTIYFDCDYIFLYI